MLSWRALRGSSSSSSRMTGRSGAPGSHLTMPATTNISLRVIRIPRRREKRGGGLAVRRPGDTAFSRCLRHITQRRRRSPRSVSSFFASFRPRILTPRTTRNVTSPTWLNTHAHLQHPANRLQGVTMTSYGRLSMPNNSTAQ